VSLEQLSLFPELVAATCGYGSGDLSIHGDGTTYTRVCNRKPDHDGAHLYSWEETTDSCEDIDVSRDWL
jgi:hypothetical protein